MARASCPFENCGKVSGWLFSTCIGPDGPRKKGIRESRSEETCEDVSKNADSDSFEKDPVGNFFREPKHPKNVREFLLAPRSSSPNAKSYSGKKSRNVNRGVWARLRVSTWDRFSVRHSTGTNNNDDTGTARLMH